MLHCYLYYGTNINTFHEKNSLGQIIRWKVYHHNIINISYGKICTQSCRLALVALVDVVVIGFSICSCSSSTNYSSSIPKIKSILQN